MRAEQFEFLSAYRGPMAALGWTRGGHEFQVMLVEWPASLLAMLKADVLGPKAKAEARKLAKKGADPVSSAPQEPGEIAGIDPGASRAARGRSVDIAGRV